MKNFKEYVNEWENIDEADMKDFTVTFSKTKFAGKSIKNEPISVKARSSREAITKAGKLQYKLSPKDSIALDSKVKAA